MSGAGAEPSEEVEREAEVAPPTAAAEVPAATAVAESPIPELVEHQETKVDAVNGETGTVRQEAAPLDPTDPMNLPPHGTEVFVGGIPKAATEEQVREFAEQAGGVHSVKLSKDPNNAEENRGFGFVRYLTAESADKAKEQLHDAQLKGTEAKLRVSSSQSKHKVYLGNIPRNWSQEQLLDELNKNLRGLDKVELVMSKETAGQNRGFAFLTFYNHECAAAGKELLSKPSYNLDGRQLTVSYAESKTTEQQQQGTQKNKSVYVGNLPPGVTEVLLKETFEKWGKVAKVVIPAATEKRPEQRFGFVHFEDQKAANEAVSQANEGQKPEVLGNTLEVKAARPFAQPAEMRQGGYDAGYEGTYGHGGRGRGFQRGGRGGRGAHGISPRGRGGRGARGTAQGAGGYDAWQNQNYGGYEPVYEQSYVQGGPYGAYGGMPLAAPASATPGMTMVPMMLPSGQVGYVLQNADMLGTASYAAYGGAGPDRTYRDSNRGGRARGPPRYRPY